MLYNKHWYLALIKTEDKLKGSHPEDQSIQRPGRVVITFQGMNAEFCVEHQRTILLAIWKCLAFARGQVTCRSSDQKSDHQIRNQMQAWRQRLLKDIWDLVQWDVDLMKKAAEDLLHI